MSNENEHLADLVLRQLNRLSETSGHLQSGEAEAVDAIACGFTALVYELRALREQLAKQPEAVQP